MIYRYEEVVADILKGDVMRLLDRLLSWLQGRCPHPDDSVVADILEGGGTSQVRWCKICGAYKFVYPDGRENFWRIPRPLWEKRAKRRTK